MYVNDEFVSRFGHTRSEAIGKTSLELGLWAEPSERDALWRAIAAGVNVQNVEVRARTKSGAELFLLIGLERIEILGEASVLGIGCDITERKRAERALAESDRRARVAFDTLPVGLTVIDREGNIVLTNPTAQRVWSDMIPSGTERYARSKGWRHDTGQAIGPDEWPSARARVNGETTVNECIDIEAFDGTRKTIVTSAAPIRDADDRITGAVFTIDDVSTQKKAERELHDSLDQLRALTGRLMRAQDEERRRVAQTMHETAAQELAALKMLLAELNRRLTLSDGDRALLVETIELADRTMNGVRTMSYLLHPPLLDEVGLVSAIRWYAEGFEHRSGIRVSVDLPALPRLAVDVETALFRVVQEALINVHRHAHSRTAHIRAIPDGEVLLEISDEGCGIPADVLTRIHRGGVPGVGLAGMRERFRQLGGELEIVADAHGTRIRAHVPLPTASA
jgi:PAS domain S-box-containing protein